MSQDTLKLLLEEHAARSVEICQELVRRPSEDPPGNTISVASYIDDFFHKNKISSQIVSPHPQKPSVIATIEGNLPGGHLIFNGHIDTFPVGDLSQWTQDPFGGKITDGRLYGRGSADMKGGVAASMAAVMILSQMRKILPGKISATYVSDEEVNGPWGTQYLLKNYPELYGDALINGEPSSIEHIRIGEKGIYQVRIIKRSTGGHGAYAGLRSNAIIDIMHLLNSLLDFEKDVPKMDVEIRALMEKARVSYDRILCSGATDAALKPSLNIGTVNGGIMVNMVPEKCEAELDFRLPPGINCEFVRTWLEKKLEKFPDTTYEVIKCTDTYLTRPDHPLVQIARQAAIESCDRPVYENYSLGGTEACLWRSKGIPAVTYGPNHHNMGSPDEYVFAEELPIVTRVHALTAWRFLNMDNGL